MEEWFKENIQSCDVLALVALLIVAIAVCVGAAEASLLKEAVIAVFAFISKTALPGGVRRPEDGAMLKR
ncbi:MAG: hypothetical protein EOM02_10345 [Synergistales bacterium]|nr:hypothetical protein [Synergistales bacterium]